MWPLAEHRVVKANLKRWRKVQLKVMTPTLQRQRDVFVRVFLPKGKYAIVPMTARQTARGRFWLSIYYDNGSLKVRGQDEGSVCEGQGIACASDTRLTKLPNRFLSLSE